ncbi:MAG: pyruvate dehydrogenase (acetyl-transferring) E1 component subunit alpha [Tenericutes bacterium HGW-Tenericutes-1]|jgi:pyruvate dehydrogenase E1 component alpha subunit|nr:MAG: pyruvate dehydrogenase (acetyl-transferring) E1 component subunit alpha [Tenericutes bacterium HGW-Tenericutes-1]
MLFDQYNPLKKKVLQILDNEGQVINKTLEPSIPDDVLLKMYQTMTLGRIADIKAIQFQRQGRMLTYAPNMGQEAAQIGPMAATSDNDWLAVSFRELNAMLYKGVTLEQLFLYWYGNEAGSKYNDSVKVLPVNVPIGSQISHAAGLAYAAKIQKKDEVVIAYIGDGGTSHGEFHEGINFGAVFNVPMVIIIQNNHWAISTPRAKASKAETLAQKAIAYGIPGIQVDGNDTLAMYVATLEAIKRAKLGQGPSLIEAITYRMGPHTTSDNPKIYRSDEEVEAWKEKDPLKRFKNYLLNKKIITQASDDALNQEYNQLVLSTFKQVEDSGLVSLEEVFNHTYQEMTPLLKEQYNDLKKYEETEGR